MSTDSGASPAAGAPGASLPARLGGTTRVVVLDNLRECVITPDVYDATLNPLHHEVLAHYGVVALPCRVRNPDRKGKVESGVGHAQKTPLRRPPLRGPRAGPGLPRPLGRGWADTRIHGTTKRQVAVMHAEEKPSLGEVPLEPFRYYHYGERTVNLDGCIEVEAAHYGAPPGWIGRRLRTLWDGLHVRLIDRKMGQLLSRPISPGSAPPSPVSGGRRAVARGAAVLWLSRFSGLVISHLHHERFSFAL